VHPNPLPPDPVIDAYKPGVDQSLFEENLALTVPQRIQKAQEHLAFAVRVRPAYLRKHQR
jgi:hypothetical protein